MIYDIVGFAVIAALALTLGVMISAGRRSSFPPWLLLLALALRVVGAAARYEVLYRYYDGVGDAVRYYWAGRVFAAQLRLGDLSVLGFDHWFGGPGSWWGTRFVENLSGLAVTLIGPTMRGLFLVFALLSFAGLYLMALVVRRELGAAAGNRFAALAWTWPSLGFWPASVGKEAVIVFALGLVVAGYAGRAGRLRWPVYLAGVLLASAVRPHVGALLALVTAAAIWLASWERVTVRRLVQAALLTPLAVASLLVMVRQFGLESPDLEGVQEFVTVRAEQTLTGGSSIGERPAGPAAVPAAFVNIWMRPSPWEAHNPMALLSSVEVVALWLLVWWWRRPLIGSLRRWRRSRLHRFAVPLLVSYTLMMGLSFGNLGIIARQRAPLFPFLFMLVVGPAPGSRAAVRGSGAGRATGARSAR